MTSQTLPARHLRVVTAEEACTHTYVSPCGRTWACARAVHAGDQHYMKRVDG